MDFLTSQRDLSWAWEGTIKAKAVRSGESYRRWTCRPHFLLSETGLGQSQDCPSTGLREYKC